MLVEIDRLVLATPNAAGVARRCQAMIGAEVAGRDRLDGPKALRTILRAGSCDIEVIEPDGEGPLADELRRKGRAHLFAAGASSTDIAATVDRARKAGAEHYAEKGQHTIAIDIEGAPIRFVISEPTTREKVGDLDYFYEVTVVAADYPSAMQRITDVFGLDPDFYVPVESKIFGYSGGLTMFSRGALHRFEVITPDDMTNTLGRYYGREGTAFYMAFAESGRMVEIERTANAAGAANTVHRPAGRSEGRMADTLFLHPPTLGGVMLGISRPTVAWTWSGQPERAEAI
jgi:hypothetical protein